MGSPAVTMKPEDWRNWSGQTVASQFLLGECLGGSEHSIVFLTEIGSDRKKAAIKLIPADPKTADLQLARWKQASQLSHPNLLRVLRWGRSTLLHTDLLYVVMEFAEEDVSQILPQRALTPDETRVLLPPVLDALGYLHANGLVHGRLKPSNILAIADQVKLSTDRVAKAGETAAHGRRGSYYDAPETATGRTSPASDVWSLGATLVEILTQFPPVSRESSILQEGASVDGTTSDDPLLLGPIPPSFMPIAQNCLRSDPERRWTLAQIKSQLESQTSSAPPAQMNEAQAPPPAAKPAPKTSAAAVREVKATAEKTSSRRSLIPIAVITLVVLAILGAMKWAQRPEGAQTTAPTTASQSTAQNQVQKPVTQSKTSAAVPSKPKTQATNANKPAPAAVASNPDTDDATDSSGREILERVMPHPSRSALNTITGTVKVRVRVSVDPSGKVSKAQLDSAGPSQYFSRLAMEAARQWKFAPSVIDGQAVASEWVLRFGYKRSGVTVSPVRTAPL